MHRIDYRTLALSAAFLSVLTLACLGLYSLIGGAADYVLMALPIVIGVWLVLREAMKRVEIEE